MGWANAKHKRDYMRHATMEYHLVYNHFPVVNREWIRPAWRAIDYVRRGQPDHMVRVPTSVHFPTEERTLTEAWRVVACFHLDDFLTT